MLQIPKSKLKYFLISTFILMTSVSCGVKTSRQKITEPTPSEIKSAMTEAAQININNSDTITFENVDQVPLYPGCESLITHEKQKLCLSKKVQNHLLTNFNTDLGKRYKLKGMNKILVTFEIGENGSVSNVRAKGSHPKLEEEAIRVINSLPKMIPGENNGNIVGVNYSLPIIFWLG